MSINENPMTIFCKNIVSVQCKFAVKYCHLLQTFLHLHLISSKHVSAASDNNIHFGTQSSEIFCRPKNFGVGTSGVGMQLFDQISAYNAVLITWRYRASWLGRMFSRFRVFLQNIFRHASFAFSWIFVRSHRTMINLSITLNCQNACSNFEKGLFSMQRNDSLTIGKDFQTCHATNLVFHETKRWYQILWAHEKSHVGIYGSRFANFSLTL